MITEETESPADPNDPTHALPKRPSKLTAFYRNGMNLSAEVKPGQADPIDFDIKVGDLRKASAGGPGGRGNR